VTSACPAFLCPAPPGQAYFTMRAIGPHPAPHVAQEVDFEIPPVLCGDIYPNPALRLSTYLLGMECAIVIPADSPSECVEAAWYGRGEYVVDVTDLVKSELSAGRPVRAGPGNVFHVHHRERFKDELERLFQDGDFKQKYVDCGPDRVSVTLNDEGKRLTETIPLTCEIPRDRVLEVFLHVGGGGGHALNINSARFSVERQVTVLFAHIVEGETTADITALSGTVVAVIDLDGVERRDPVRLGKAIREQVRSAMPGVSFKVLMAGSSTETLCSSFTPMSDQVDICPP